MESTNEIQDKLNNVFQICNDIQRHISQPNFIDCDPIDLELQRLHAEVIGANKNDVKHWIRLFKDECNRKIYDRDSSPVPHKYVINYGHACIFSALQMITTAELDLDSDLAEATVISEIDQGLVVTGALIDAKLRDLLDKLISELHGSKEKIQPQGLMLCPDFKAQLVSRLYYPHLSCNVRQLLQPTVKQFENELTSGMMPLHLIGAANSWPAIQHWNSLDYLLSKTNNGLRVVPVEVGKSYVSNAWSQKLVTLRSLLHEWTNPCEAAEVKYLAQHDLLAQVPVLRKDVLTPNVVYSQINDQERAPVLNSWLGPAGTISPLHTDPNHNVLVQVVGFKYVRLYPPSTKGITSCNDMGNTCDVELESGAFGALFEDEDVSASSLEDDVVDFEKLKARVLAKKKYQQQFSEFPWTDGYVECILAPGDEIFVPSGWWHYVRSLTPSFSVSFWF
ncbi:hypothetical protein V1514DRAFT_325781 [Lipomyces japonicus]|uniref:uncharacterized protein n=1 Tax=Lipomyces japonicus TaxID=56871 RepID=UPI0034CE4E11